MTAEERENALRSKAVSLVLKSAAEKDKAALEFMLNSEQGRWFIVRLFDKCNLNTDLFNVDSSIMARLSGKRSIALDYLDAIQSLGLEGLEFKQLAEREYAEFVLAQEARASKLIDKGDYGYE